MLLRLGIRASRITVWRILRRNGWLASCRRKTTCPGRLHEGRVATQVPNARWASDITRVKSADGSQMRLAAIVDCCDRMVLAWRLGSRITSEDLCEIIREATFRRFGEDREKARGIEFLSDNGPEFSSVRFQGFLELLGLIRCHTPIRSPESNGVMEAFFGTLKRDYIWQHDLPTPKEVSQALPGWIADYNEVAPHSALGMKSPAQFYREWLSKKG